MVKVLFVCLGNICRSPTAHGVFEHMLKSEQLASKVSVESAGTGAWHVGNPPDGRALKAALERGVDLSHIRARKVEESDFSTFDYILAMDNNNLADLQAECPSQYLKKVMLFLSFGSGLSYREVPDPYYGGAKGFDTVLDLVENACEGLLTDIKRVHL